MPCWILFFHPAHGKKDSEKGLERLRRRPGCATAALTFTWWWITAGAHVCTLQLTTHQQTPPMSAIQADQSHHWGMWSTRLRWYLVPSCFAAYVTDPFVTTCPPSPPDSAHLSLHHSALSGMGQFISLLSWHFHLAPRCYISLTGGEWMQREEPRQTSQRWQDARWPLDSNP